MTYYYSVEVFHEGLNKYRVVRGVTKKEAEEKAHFLYLQWEEQWKKKIEQERKKIEQQQKRIERENRIKCEKEANIYAMELTYKAEKLQEDVDRILLDSLGFNGLDFFEKLKDFSLFNKPKPEAPNYLNCPNEPNIEDERFNPKPSFLIKMFKNKMDEFNKVNNEKFIEAHEEWEREYKKVNKINADKKKEYDKCICIWEKEKEEFYNNQVRKNSEIDRFKENVRLGKKSEVERYANLVLEKAPLPFDYEKIVITDYVGKEKQLFVELYLPSIESLPNLKNVTYIKSTGEYKEKIHSETYMKKKYDNVVYQIVLQTLYYCFNLVEEDLISLVVLNGRIKTIDKSNGKK